MADKERVGQSCPYCACRYSEVRKTTKVEYSYRGVTYTKYRRYRQCGNRHCGLYFWTRESVERETLQEDKLPDVHNDELPDNPYAQ